MVELWLLGVFVVAVVGAYALTGLTARYGYRLGLLDYPRPNELQEAVVARTGGYGICAAFLLAVGVSLLAPLPELQRSPADALRLAGMLLGLVPLLLLAYLDDWRRLGALPQLVGQLAIAAVPVSFGLWIDSIALPYFQVVYLPAWVGVPLTLLWLVAMINTIN